jgi:hypothetical protein
MPLMKLADARLLIGAFDQCASSPELGAVFAKAIEPHGFPMVSCGDSRETPTGRVWDFFFNTWPTEWLVEYQRKDYVRHDVLPAMARLTANPYTWQELKRGREQSPGQIELNKWVNGLGVVDAYAVPIHQPGSDVGLCVSVSDHPVEDIEERMALHMASLYALPSLPIAGAYDRSKFGQESTLSS